jgi:hypothetical protein
MAEVLVEFDTIVTGDDGSRWIPRVCGGVADDGLWEAWIEFEPTNPSSAMVRTPRETEQSKRDDLMYWAQGLSQAYLDQALRRALHPPPAAAAEKRKVSPTSDKPAPRLRHTVHATIPRPILDPFDVYAQGERVLIQQLSGLDAARLRDIAVGYGFLEPNAAAGQSHEALSAAIVAAVRTQRGSGPESGVR